MVKKNLIKKLKRILRGLIPLGTLLAAAVASAQASVASPTLKPAAKKTPAKSTKAAAPVPVAATTPAAPTGPVYILTPKDVAELVLKQSYKAQEVNFSAQQIRIKLAEVEKKYDFQLSADSGYQKSKFEGEKWLEDEQLTTNVGLTKSFFTGTTVGLSYARLSDKPIFASTATEPYNKYTQDVFGVTLEQDILENFFGVADRASLRSAKATVKAAEVDRVTNLQTTVLDGIRLYWSTYVAQETFQEALNSRNRYVKLVDEVRKKSGYGYSNPGELSQAQAELEGREQKVKSASVDYLSSLDSLTTLLRLPPKAEIRFVVPEDIPAPPKMESVDIENLRPLRSSKLKAEAAEDDLKAANSQNLPDLALVGKYYNQGREENADDAYSEMAGGSRPKYYVGVKLTYNFGSSYKDEFALNKRVGRDLAEAQLNRERLEMVDKEQNAIRKIQSAYANALSARAQRGFREKAAQELNRAYSQGRTEISNFIDVLNKYFDSEVALSKAIGDYQTALNEWAAFRDELIPENKEDKN